MNFRKLWAAFRELWWVLRIHLWLKWLRLTDPALKETTFRIKPENIVLKSWRPEERHVTTNMEGQPVEYLHSQWTGEVYFAFLEDHAKFTISVKGIRPNTDQIEFLRELMRKKQSMWKYFEIEIFKHYHQFVHRHMDFYDRHGENINDKVAPRVDSPSGIRPLLHSTPRIYFDEHDVTNSQFDICFPCTWEPVGMGITVTVRDWKITGVH
jgi:hypothetical protein